MTRPPQAIRLRAGGQALALNYADGREFELAAEYLRVHSPSAEVQGHGPGEGKLVGGKQDVTITAVDPVGRYAVRLRFSDGHDTGLYSWSVLADLADHQSERWSRYLQRIEESGMSRQASDNIVPLNALLKNPRK